MSLARFVFLAVSVERPDETLAEGVAWMLISPNNRPLGRSWALYPGYTAATEAVGALRTGFGEIKVSPSLANDQGQWNWRIDLRGEPVAGATRSYLRIRECAYNLECFLTAVPVARVVAGARAVRGGRWRGGDAAKALR